MTSNNNLNVEKNKAEVSKNVPELRFQGFIDAWEQRKFEDIYNIISGFAFKMSDYTSGGVKIINGEAINHGTVESNNWNYLPNAFLEKYSNFILRTGDIVLGLNRPITNNNLKIAQIPSDLDNSLLYQRAGKVEFLKDVDINFSFQILNNEIYKFVLKEAQGSDQPFISTTKLKKWNFLIPKNELEQQKIGSFFKQLDDTIALHQRKLDKLKRLKQGYLQQLFPKNDEKVPRVRFANFDEDWEQCKLGNVAKITMGQSPNSENYTDNPDDYILVQGNADMKGGRVFPRVWTTQVTKTAEKNDLILSVRAPVGDIGKTDYNVVLGRGVAAIKGNEFLFQLLGKMKQNDYWTKLSTGSTFESINSNDIKEALILLPNEDEQVKIGSFFANLDQLFTLHQSKLDKLKSLKQSLLQKMFI